MIVLSSEKLPSYLFLYILRNASIKINVDKKKRNILSKGQLLSAASFLRLITALKKKSGTRSLLVRTAKNKSHISLIIWTLEHQNMLRHSAVSISYSAATGIIQS